MLTLFRIASWDPWQTEKGRARKESVLIVGLIARISSHLASTRIITFFRGEIFTRLSTE